MNLPARIRITEVGPRDGLQNEARTVSIAAKAEFIDLLSASGVAEIEVTSFVDPRRIPQLADGADVFRRITRRPGVVYSALVPNERGLEAALAAGVDKIAVFTAASETFSRRNTNATIAETLARFKPLIARAAAGGAGGGGLPVRAYISCIVACPYEGPIAPRQVREVAAALLDLGATEIDLGETIGVAAPTDIERLYEGLVGLLEPAQTTLHLHDTRGTALASACKAAELGVASFDASCAGLGGCPFAPGAAGNVATEELVYCFERMGIATGVELERLIAAGRFIAAALERPLPSRLLQSASLATISAEGLSRCAAG